MSSFFLVLASFLASAGVAWPGGEGAILAVLALVLIASLALTSWMRHERRRTAAAALAVRSAGP